MPFSWHVPVRQFLLQYFQHNCRCTSVALSDKVKLLGVILDRHLMLDSHIVQVYRSLHFHTRELRHISNITNDIAKSLALALVNWIMQIRSFS